jgi:hypothetical protein
MCVSIPILMCVSIPILVCCCSDLGFGVEGVLVESESQRSPSLIAFQLPTHWQNRLWVLPQFELVAQPEEGSTDTTHHAKLHLEVEKWIKIINF